ncbi:MAG: diadenylate cyclase CdaA [Bacteroidota bacterium]
MLYLFDIGFLPIRIWDVLDILIVGYLIYRIYLLLRGSIAFNIFVGVVMLYLVWWLVGMLKMDMLTLILSQFVNVGFIIIIIIFQPEVRRFLLFLGNTTLGGRTTMVGKWWATSFEGVENRKTVAQEIKGALMRMSRDKVGALLVFAKNLDLAGIGHSGTMLDAQVSQALLVSIFQKDSPLHDGAVVISKGKILAASRILPVSETLNLPRRAGLRHRAGLGITERTTAASFIVSEATGGISFAEDGKMEIDLDEARVTELLNQLMSI